MVIKIPEKICHKNQCRFQSSYPWSNNMVMKTPRHVYTTQMSVKYFSIDEHKLLLNIFWGISHHGFSNDNISIYTTHTTENQCIWLWKCGEIWCLSTFYSYIGGSDAWANSNLGFYMLINHRGQYIKAFLYTDKSQSTKQMKKHWFMFPYIR